MYGWVNIQESKNSKMLNVEVRLWVMRVHCKNLSTEKKKSFNRCVCFKFFIRKILGKVPMPRTFPQINGFNWSGMGPGCQYFLKLPVVEKP